MRIIIIGGGAAGFFSALAAKEARPDIEVILIEKSAKLLSKVRISGGGRCNVTHACFDPAVLVKNYPRGNRELLGPFHRFQPKDTIDWFQARSVELKTESDGRMFPTTDSSETIIGCLLQEAERLGVDIRTRINIEAIRKDDQGFLLEVKGGSPLGADRIILATGSGPAGWSAAKSLGHSIQVPVPSLFTFNIPAFPLVGLAGVSTPNATLTLENTPHRQTGPLLITHWGFSGPAALKLSAFGARILAEKGYEIPLHIDWLPEVTEGKLKSLLEHERKTCPTKSIASLSLPPLPKRLLRTLLEVIGISGSACFNTLSNAAITTLCHKLKNDIYHVKGKTTNKEEFVTCGGVTLSEVNFKTMESKLCPGLYFCGEVLDIDGITGGFNFQNAWTTGWIAGNAAAQTS